MVLLLPALWPNNYFWLGHSSAIHACWESGREGRKFLDNPKCHLTTDMVCVCVCVCVWVCVCVIMKHVFDNFWWFKKCLSFFFRLSIWPLSTCYGEVCYLLLWFDFFFETPFLSPIMISMQANPKRKNIMALIFSFFFCGSSKAPLDLPNLQKQWESLPLY